MNNKHYLSEMSKDELKDMILYPAEIWQRIYDVVAGLNSDYSCDLAKWILGETWHKDYEVDSCSYTWWMNIRSGHYAATLAIADYDYFSDDDAKKIKELQAKVKELKDKVDNLEDCDDYYYKISEWEDQADKYANDIAKIVEKELKEREEVTDEQCLEVFIESGMADDYYYLGDDKTKVYRDINYTETLKTNYKGDK